MLKKLSNYSLSGNSYEKFPEMYDLLYKRYFLSIPNFVKLVISNVSIKNPILEIASGTGEVTIPLLELGYDVTSLDLNWGMLKFLKKKAIAKNLKPKLIHRDMNQIQLKEKFDLIYMRQSINYFMGEKKLTAGLKKIRQALKNNGKFIFNAPNYNIQTKEYPTVANIYNNDKLKAFVLETNILKKRILVHSQESIVWNDHNFRKHIKDKNTFYMFTKNDFNKCLKNAGFLNIKFFGNKINSYKESDKTIYGVATK